MLKKTIYIFLIPLIGISLLSFTNKTNSEKSKDEMKNLNLSLMPKPRGWQIRFWY